MAIEADGGRAAAIALCGPAAQGLRLMDASVLEWTGNLAGTARVKAIPTGGSGASACEGELSFELDAHRGTRVTQVSPAKIELT